MTARIRADRLLVARGLFESRAKAQAAIAAGLVLANGATVRKASEEIDADALIDAAPEHPYVSRGGPKLAAALDHFAFDPRDRICLDVGASTGGFTDVLLQRGAKSVIALDVGHGQLDWRLRNDSRVLVRERVNARTLTGDDVPYIVDLVTIDVAFISLRHIFPALPPVLARGSDIVALVKPQFEAGRGEVGRGGLVTDPAVHDAVIARTTEAAIAAGLTRAGMTPSPITGAKGNREFFLHLRYD